MEAASKLPILRLRFDHFSFPMPRGPAKMLAIIQILANKWYQLTFASTLPTTPTAINKRVHSPIKWLWLSNIHLNVSLPQSTLFTIEISDKIDTIVNHDPISCAYTEFCRLLTLPWRFRNGSSINIAHNSWEARDSSIWFTTFFFIHVRFAFKLISNQRVKHHFSVWYSKSNLF